MVLPGNEQLPYTTRNDGLLLRIKAFPKSERNAIAGVRNGELVVRIQAPALKGQANKELVKFLAKTLAISRSEIKILSGEASRHKLVSLPLTVSAALEDIL